MKYVLGQLLLAILLAAIGAGAGIGFLTTMIPGSEWRDHIWTAMFAFWFIASAVEFAGIVGDRR